MPAQVYNPYESQMSTADIALGMAGDLVNPLIWFQYPGTYRWSGQIALPGFVKELKNVPSQIGLAGRAFEKYGVGAVPRGIKRLWRAKGKLVGPTWVGEELAVKAQHIKAYKTMMSDRFYQSFVSEGIDVRKANRLSKFYSKELINYIDKAEDFQRLGAKAHLSAKVLPKKMAVAEDVVEKSMRKSFGDVRTKTRVLPFMTRGGITSIQGRTRLLKWGARTGKVLGTGFLIGMVADIASMFGQTAGRALVSKADEILTGLSQRYMPEMGGQLSLSYLSRAAATERQRAVNALSKSHLNGRSALGQEAAFNHL